MIPSAGFDQPSDKDWIEFDELWGEELPIEAWVGKWLEIQDQGKDIATKMGCWTFMIVHAVNAMNLHRGNTTFMYDWAQEFENFIEKYQHTPKYKNIDIRTQGSYLQDQLEFAQKTGMIAGYYRISWIPQHKKALSSWRAIATGSQKINWRATREEPYVAQGNSWSGHLFAGLRYRDMVDLLSFPNSYWLDSYDNGYFHLRYDDLWLLYSQYALIPKEEKMVVLQVRINLYLSRIVMVKSKGQPSELERMTYGKYLKYWERRGDRAWV